MMNKINNKGFTMIELLAVAVVIIAVSSIISAILFSSLRGVSKTSVTDAVRQSGNAAISKLSREIKFAKTFKGVSVDGQGVYTTDCSTFGITPAPTPAKNRFIKIENLDSQTVILSCEDDPSVSGKSIYQQILSSDEQTIITAKQSLLDTEVVEMTLDDTDTSCYFTCSQNVITDPPTIGINFMLSQKDSQTSFFEQKASAEFQTSVTFRNLNK